MIRSLATRLGNVIKRAILDRIDDSEGTQLAQVSMLDDEVQDRVEHLQPYGISFHPPTGSEAVALAVQGEGSHRVVICATKRGDRPTGIAEGEGGLYSLGTWRVFIDADGDVHLAAQTGAAKMARADRVDAEITRIWNTLTTWTTVANDGGAALQAAAITAEESVGSTAADKVHGT